MLKSEEKKIKLNKLVGDISDEINEIIDDKLEKDNQQQPRREYIGGSSIGDDCKRKLQYRLLGLEPDKHFEGRTLRIFGTGNAFEDMAIGWLTRAGFNVREKDKTGKQFGFSHYNDRIKGHVDGIIMASPFKEDYPYLWECKSANDSNWKKFKKNGVAKTNKVYFAQIVVYQYYMGLTENPALFTVVNKNTQEIYHERVLFDSQFAQECSDKAALILKATDAQELMPRVAFDRDHFNCRFCEFSKRCWDVDGAE